MIVIKIANEYKHGPIWVYGEDGMPTYSFPIIYNDARLQELNKKARELYDSFYAFNTPNATCEFSYDKEKSCRDEMLMIIKEIVVRLEEISDGSFVVEDHETNYLSAL